MNWKKYFFRLAIWRSFLSQLKIFMCFLYLEFVYFAYFIVIQIFSRLYCWFCLLHVLCLAEHQRRKNILDRVCDLYDQIVSSSFNLLFRCSRWLQKVKKSNSIKYEWVCRHFNKPRTTLKWFQILQVIKMNTFNIHLRLGSSHLTKEIKRRERKCEFYLHFYRFSFLCHSPNSR